MYKITVVTPSNRGPAELQRLKMDFHQQTFAGFEHLIIYDGEPTEEIRDIVVEGNTKLISIRKSKDKITGTTPRNKGIEYAHGDYIVFADDDDRYKSTYLESLMEHTDIHKNELTVVRMACQESRISRNGNPNRIVCIPERDMPVPRICHIGTPCFIVPTAWAREQPWRDEPEHDFHFYNRIVQKYKPKITLIEVMQVDVDSETIGDMEIWR